jgi:hypothetical protein
MSESQEITMPAKSFVTGNGSPLVQVGTTKAMFLFTSDRARKTWRMSGPHFPGHTVYASAYDGRAGRQRLWMASFHWAYGVTLRHSDDFGATWSDPAETPIKFPEDTGVSLKQIWQIAPGPANQPDTIYCGVEPAALFVSHDAGTSWSLVRGLWDHPHREKWNPGAGGLCMHTVLPHPTDPNKMLIAVSAAGVYRTEDGGKTWQVSNKGIRADFNPEKYPEFGQCVHKIDRHPSRPDTFFLQNHGGLYRSDDGGKTWNDIGKGVPSDFGFSMVVNPNDPNTAYIFPLDDMRCGPEGKVRVYRTTNGGKKWEPMTRGLPQKDAYETVLRDAMCADSLNPAGIYFGTRSGKVFASNNDGTSWKQIAEGLPPVTSVKAAVVGEKSRASSPRRTTARRAIARPAARSKAVPRRRVR